MAALLENCFFDNDLLKMIRNTAWNLKITMAIKQLRLRVKFQTYTYIV